MGHPQAQFNKNGVNTHYKSAIWEPAFKNASKQSRLAEAENIPGNNIKEYEHSTSLYLKFGVINLWDTQWAGCHDCKWSLSSKCSQALI